MIDIQLSLSTPAGVGAGTVWCLRRCRLGLESWVVRCRCLYSSIIAAIAETLDSSLSRGTTVIELESAIKRVVEPSHALASSG